MRKKDMFEEKDIGKAEENISKEKVKAGEESSGKPSLDGLYVARVFKQECMLAKQRSGFRRRCPMKLVPAAGELYESNKELFDNFANMATHNSFDVKKYAEWCASNGEVADSSICTCLSSTLLVDAYMMHAKEEVHLKNVYKWLAKSILNIANECVAEGFFTVKDFLLNLIETHKVGAYAASGRISFYWLASVPNFDKVIRKLDYFSRTELALLESHFEIYHSDANKAFLKMRNVAFNPIKMTDLAIEKIRAKSKKV